MRAEEKKSLFYSRETRTREAQQSTQDDTDNERQSEGWDVAHLSSEPSVFPTPSPKREILNGVKRPGAGCYLLPISPQMIWTWIAAPYRAKLWAQEELRCRGPRAADSGGSRNF